MPKTMPTPGFIDLNQAVNEAFALDAKAASEEQRFAARVYLRAAKKRMSAQFSPLTANRDAFVAKLQRIDERIAELA